MVLHHLAELAASLLRHGKHATDAATAVPTATEHAPLDHTPTHHPTASHPVQFGEWVDGAGSDYKYERYDGVYTGNYQKK